MTRGEVGEIAAAINRTMTTDLREFAFIKSPAERMAPSEPDVFGIPIH
jgi:hypothetical protein